MRQYASNTSSPTFVFVSVTSLAEVTLMTTIATRLDIPVYIWSDRCLTSASLLDQSHLEAALSDVIVTTERDELLLFFHENFGESFFCESKVDLRE